jgi:hypothetical protein
VFCVSAGVEEAAYVEAAATYFPRNSEEEIASRAACEGEQLDEFGDVVLGRSVSIGRVPADTQALVDAGRGGASGGSAAHQAADWSQTLLRYDALFCAAVLLEFAFVYLSCIITRRPRSHARC